MQCPLCEAENREDALECAECGKVLRTADAGADGIVTEQLPQMEGTALEQDPDTPLQWTAHPSALERTMIDADPAAPSNWTGGVELDRGRDEDPDPRTPMPAETATCPWCGAVSLEAVCDSCGHRKSRYTAATPAGRQRAAAGEMVSCPACFARVART